MKMKKISVVLPVYNGSRTIAKAVNSVLSQTYSNLELIIVNDCSSDNTLEIIKNLASADDRIIIRHNDFNMKLPISLNKGFELATGDYYTWTSHDNVYKDNALEVLANALDNNEEVDLVYSDFNMVEMDGSIRSVEKKAEPEMLKFINCVGACFMYRKTLADKIGDYDSEMFLAEDYEYWIRAYLNGKLMHITENLYDYGWHDKSLTVTRRCEIAHKTFEAKDKHLKELYVKCRNDEEKIRFFDEMLDALSDNDEKKRNEKQYFKMCKAFKKYKLRKKKKNKQDIARENRLRIKAKWINRIKQIIKFILQ